MKHGALIMHLSLITMQTMVISDVITCSTFSVFQFLTYFGSLQAITALKKGSYLLKYGRRGKPKFCPFQLSNVSSLGMHVFKKFLQYRKKSCRQNITLSGHSDKLFYKQHIAISFFLLHPLIYVSPHKFDLLHPLVRKIYYFLVLSLIMNWCLIFGNSTIYP